MMLADATGLPLTIDVASANRAEVDLIEPLVHGGLLPYLPDRLIYDKAADCDSLRSRLAKGGVELICPHRRNRKRPKRQDGRKLRRYRRRWKIERSISWLQHFRRLVVRYDYHAYIFEGFVQLACILIAIRRF